MREPQVSRGDLLKYRRATAPPVDSAAPAVTGRGVVSAAVGAAALAAEEGGARDERREAGAVEGCACVRIGEVGDERRQAKAVSLDAQVAVEAFAERRRIKPGAMMRRRPRATLGQWPG